LKAKIILIAGAVTVSAAAVLILSLCYKNTTAARNSNSNKAPLSQSSKVSGSTSVSNSSTSSSSSSDISSIGKFAKIKPTDSEDVKERKRQYNELENEGDKLHDDWLAKFKSNTLTEEDDKEYRGKCQEIRDKQKALGIDPTEDETADEKFRSNIDGYISTCELGKSMYLDDHGNVNPADREKYERACRKEEYLKKVKKDYEEGKITADEALKSFDEFNNIK
jgi:hypothetical protein